MSGARERIDLRHYLRLVWRWKWLLAAVVITIPVAVYLISKQLPKTYEASTTVFVQATTVSSSDEPGATTVSTSSPQNIARLVATPLVANVAARKLGEPGVDGRDLLGSVTATLDAQAAAEASNFLTITARDEDPERARDIAAAFARALAVKRTRQAQQAIDKTIKSLSDQADAVAALGPAAKLDLAQQLQELQTLRASQLNTTQIVDPVVKPGAPISPNPRRSAKLAGLFALLLAAGLLPFLDRLDRRIRSVDQLEEAGGAPLLAGIPKAAFPGQRPEPRVREAFQTLRAALTSFNVDRSLATVIVTSAGHGDGKTTVVTNLAVALAQDGREVVLVDGDLRQPEVAKRMGVEPGIGIEAVLLDDRPVDDALVEVEGVSGGRLRVISTVSFPPNPSVLLGSERMKTLLAELAEISDIVLIDTPPLMVVGDAIPLLKGVSGTILVGRLDYTEQDALVKTAQVISTAGGKIVGVVSTGAPAGGLYGYDVYDAATGTDEAKPLVAATQNGGSAAASGLLSRLARRPGKDRAKDATGSDT